MIRSLIFTLLLEEREYGRLTQQDGSRLVTDAVLRWEQDSAKDPSITLAASMRDYVNDVTDHHRCAPGVWQRYVDTLKAGDERPTSTCATCAQTVRFWRSGWWSTVDGRSSNYCTNGMMRHTV